MGDGGCERMQSYRDLEIYRLAHELAVETHKFSLLLPKYENYEAGSQLRQSAKSVAANIVEGFCRRHYKAEWIRFLIFAHGSCNESIEWLELIGDCHPDLQMPAIKLAEQYDLLSRKLNRFIQSVSSQHQSPK